MPGMAGRPGSWGGLVLRVGQAVCAGVMGSSLGFANYTAFCNLLASMVLQSLWSLGLACLDGYALKAKKDLTSPILVSLFLVGDWVTAILSFAASCSAGGAVIFFKRDLLFCRRWRLPGILKLCRQDHPVWSEVGGSPSGCFVLLCAFPVFELALAAGRQSWWLRLLGLAVLCCRPYFSELPAAAQCFGFLRRLSSFLFCWCS